MYGFVYLIILFIFFLFVFMNLQNKIDHLKMNIHQFRNIKSHSPKISVFILHQNTYTIGRYSNNLKFEYWEFKTRSNSSTFKVNGMFLSVFI
jgi:hypothetical protein